MLTKANMYALDRLLLERFGGKVPRGLALELSCRRETLRSTVISLWPDPHGPHWRR